MRIYEARFQLHHFACRRQNISWNEILGGGGGVSGIAPVPYIISDFSFHEGTLISLGGRGGGGGGKI